MFWESRKESERVQRRSLEEFRCAKCDAPLVLSAVASEDPSQDEIIEGKLRCPQGHTDAPIVRSIPRFVASESYAANWGFQWNRFDRIQVDSVMRNDLSRDRFYKTTGWPSRMEGQRILEVGCGAGRFTQLALEAGAELVSFDLSSSVEAALRNNPRQSRWTLFQGSIYDIPLKKNSFDKIFCMGVLQFCPDVEGAFRSMLPFLKAGGEIVVDVYERSNGLPPLKTFVRPVTKRLKTENLYKLLCWTIPPAFEVKKAIHQVPAVGRQLAKLIPIGAISHTDRGLNYTDEELKQVKILSALNMLSPAFEHPQRMEEVRRWFTESGLVEVELKRGYNGINAKGRRLN
jgi:ubiquinone/menaquinone biosynthesis C-methylase UbiE